eukprot:4798276-Alexandrium_andersonii.AAC.1
MVGHPSWEGHPLASRGSWDKCVPLGIHGDSVPVSGISRKWAKSVLVISWQSLVASGSTLDFVYLITLCFKHLLVKNAHRDSLKPVWEKIA